MNDVFKAVAFLIVLFAIAALFVLFSGNPDMADAWRCKALEMPMSQCRGPVL